METTKCVVCGGQCKHYDSVYRIVRTKYGKVNKVIVPRVRCTSCNRIQRELPEFIFPFKHYEKEIIIGVVEGLITCETTGFEDYPCELTMKRWMNTIDISVL